MMNQFKTPVKQRNTLLDKIQIPPSPLMKQIGYGTGVAVYELERSPIYNKVQSPWALKKIIHKFKKNENVLDKQIQKEAEVLRKLNHPNIVGFRAFLKDPDGHNVLAMEECNSGLGDMIDNRFEESLGPFPAYIIIKVAYDIAKALNYLHNEALLLHGDVKSYNILVEADFTTCKLCDFGNCLPVLKCGEIDLEKTGDETEYSGTTAWCAPEVLKFPQDVSTMADIYAFGLIIWEMIALTPPIIDNYVPQESIEEGSMSELNSSDQSVNMSDLNPESIRKRPSLPDVHLSKEYNCILEIYYCCTSEYKTKRPTARDLTVIFDNIVLT